MEFFDAKGRTFAYLESGRLVLTPLAAAHFERTDRLDLSGNTELEELPEGLRVDKLFLRGCTRLARLPRRLDVSFLSLAQCMGLGELPTGLTALRFHDLRHSAVSRMIAARIPIPIVAKVVGWSSSTMAKMASRYGHFGVEELRSAVESISSPAFVTGYPQNPPQSASEPKANVN